MTVTRRYDEAAADYVRYWAPVLVAAAHGVLELVSDAIDRGPSSEGDGQVSILDLGTGTGALAIEVARRWPEAEIVGVDASGGMLDAACRLAREAGVPRERIRWVKATAESIPIADASIDIVVSSFVLQLVPDRPAALREVLRLLRPGGRFAFVTWLEDETNDFPPAEEYDEAVLALGVEEPERAAEDVAGDFPSARAAADQLRRAGFRGVTAGRHWLEYPWDLESYLDYKQNYGESALFSVLQERDAERLRRSSRERLQRLPASAFVWRTPVVYASAIKPVGDAVSDHSLRRSGVRRHFRR